MFPLQSMPMLMSTSRSCSLWFYTPALPLPYHSSLRSFVRMPNLRRALFCSAAPTRRSSGNSRWHASCLASMRCPPSNDVARPRTGLRQQCSGTEVRAQPSLSTSMQTQSTNLPRVAVNSPKCPTSLLAALRCSARRTATLTPPSTTMVRRTVSIDFHVSHIHTHGVQHLTRSNKSRRTRRCTCM